MQFIQERRRLVLLVLVVLVLLCLVGALFINQFTGGNGVAADTPTPPPTPTEEGPVVIVTPEEGDATATPTRVVGEGEEPSEEPTPEATEVAGEPTVEPTAVSTAASSPTAAEFVLGPSGAAPAVLQTGDVLKNGGFEAGFDDSGVGADWQHFTNGEAIVSFSSETFEALIQAGSKAQRISVDQAMQADRYAGIYQTLEVKPGETYTFTLYGQTRTFFGDVQQSSHGYRVQYAVDFAGGDDWQQIPVEDWVELPWGEETISASNPTLSEYSAEIIPTSNQMTLFVRVWNKWPDPGLVEYTLDSLSLVGPVPGTAIASTTTTNSTGATTTTTTTEDAMIDQPLPVTGTQDLTSLMGDVRFWGGILVLLLLGVGAVYRAKWRW